MIKARGELNRLAGGSEPLGARAAAAPVRETLAPSPRDRRRGLRHVALIVESAVAPRRMMLTGVARYIQEHEPWAVYLKPFGVERSLPEWLQNWHGDGIIAAVKDPASRAAKIGRAHVELQSPVHLVCRLLLEKKK